MTMDYCQVTANGIGNTRAKRGKQKTNEQELQDHSVTSFVSHVFTPQCAQLIGWQEDPEQVSSNQGNQVVAAVDRAVKLVVTNTDFELRQACGPSVILYGT